MQKILILLLGLLLVIPAQAQTEESVLINDGELDIPFTRYATASDTPLILWLPSSHGTSPNQSLTAAGLSKLGIETWTVDLHLAYFLDPGRTSIEQFKADDIAQLIRYAANKTGQKVYVMSSDAGALPALRGIAAYQRQAQKLGETMALGGAILFEPKLNYPSREPGEQAQYFPIARNSTIPIYYIQPTNSTRQWRSKEIVEMLQSGGSQVFLRAMPDIVSGFQQRPDEDLNDIDLAQRDKLPSELKRAIQVLDIQATPVAPVAVELTTEASPAKAIFGLKKLPGETALSLSLKDANGKLQSISYVNNSLTLVSFWASWCQPCIVELPALKRFYDDYADKGLRIITINVGESGPAMQTAIERFSMQGYTNLSDPEGETMKAWNVLGFPTNFLVSHEGLLSHGSFGAVEWDSAEVRALIDGQLN